MTIKIRKTLLDRILNKFGYHRHAKLPDNYQDLRDKFGPHVHIQTTGDLDLSDDQILNNLSTLSDKLVAVASSIKGLEELNQSDRQAAEYGLISIVLELSNDVTRIHGQCEKKGW